MERRSKYILYIPDRTAQSVQNVRLGDHHVHHTKEEWPIREYRSTGCCDPPCAVFCRSISATTSGLSNRYNGALLYRATPACAVAKLNTPDTGMSGVFCVTTFRARRCTSYAALELSFCMHNCLANIRQTRAFCLSRPEKEVAFRARNGYNRIYRKTRQGRASCAGTDQEHGPCGN